MESYRASSSLRMFEATGTGTGRLAPPSSAVALRARAATGTGSDDETKAEADRGSAASSHERHPAFSMDLSQLMVDYRDEISHLAEALLDDESDPESEPELSENGRDPSKVAEEEHT